MKRPAFIFQSIFIRMPSLSPLEVKHPPGGRSSVFIATSRVLSSAGISFPSSSAVCWLRLCSVKVSYRLPERDSQPATRRAGYRLAVEARNAGKNITGVHLLVAYFQFVLCVNSRPSRSSSGPLFFGYSSVFWLILRKNTTTCLLAAAPQCSYTEFSASSSGCLFPFSAAAFWDYTCLSLSLSYHWYACPSMTPRTLIAPYSLHALTQPPGLSIGIL